MFWPHLHSIILTRTRFGYLLPWYLPPPTLLETHQRGKEAAEDINTPLFLPQYVRGQRYFSYAVTGWLLGYIVLYVNELSLHFRPAKRHAKSKYIKRAQKKRTLILQCAVHVYEFTIESSTPACARVRERACLRTCVEWSCSCVARAFYNCYIYIYLYIYLSFRSSCYFLHFMLTYVANHSLDVIHTKGILTLDRRYASCTRRPHLYLRKQSYFSCP